LAPANGEPTGPSPEEEAAFLAAERANGSLPAARAFSGENAGNAGPAGELPPLEDLVKRIPAATRELADQLFRAKYIGARSVPRK